MSTPLPVSGRSSSALATSASASAAAPSPHVSIAITASLPTEPTMQFTARLESAVDPTDMPVPFSVPLSFVLKQAKAAAERIQPPFSCQSVVSGVSRIEADFSDANHHGGHHGGHGGGHHSSRRSAPSKAAGAALSCALCA
jgi:hypothetical protein